MEIINIFYFILFRFKNSRGVNYGLWVHHALHAHLNKKILDAKLRDLK